MHMLYESQESSSPMITRAVAAGLTDTNFEGYSFSTFEKAALFALGTLPQSLSQMIIPKVQRESALDQQDVKQLKIKDLVNTRIADYEGLDSQLPAVVMGVGMGGATTHLSIALNAPFLPQAFVMTLREGSIDGNVQRYFERSRDLARDITDANPEVMSIQHYDPIHDGWLVKRVNHLRLKLTRMPEEYKSFIKSRIKSGGDVVYLEGGARWLRYQVGGKNVFQVGGWGDISAEEFLNGSERIERYCKSAGITQTCWKLDGYPLVEGAESEWGSEPGLAEEIETFCRQEGYRFVRIRFENPNDFSLLAFHAAAEQFRLNKIEPKGTVVETFSQYDPAAITHYGLLPLWLIFNTQDSLRFLSKASRAFERHQPVFFSALSTFSLTPDMVSWDQWQESLSDFNLIHVGARKSHYPADTLALIRWQTWLKEAVVKNSISHLKPLDASNLERIAEALK